MRRQEGGGLRVERVQNVPKLMVSQAPDEWKGKRHMLRRKRRSL